jgi:hypothetical protein
LRNGGIAAISRSKEASRSSHNAERITKNAGALQGCECILKRVKNCKSGVPAILALLLVWLSLCPVECAQAAAASPAELTPAACHASEVDPDAAETRCQECWNSSNFVQGDKFQLIHFLAADNSPTASFQTSPSFSMPSFGSIADPPLLLRQSPVLLI